jgi:hypothetical protein
MKTVSEMIAWFKSPSHIKCTLVDIDGVLVNGISTNLRLSTVAYTDSVAGAHYNACIAGGLNFTESLSMDGSISVNFGSLDLINTYGINDQFLNYVWNRRSIKIYLGSPGWVKSDFTLIFDGLVSELTANNESILTLVLYDKLQRLNDSLTEKTLYDSTDTYTEKVKGGINNETLMPLLFGECFNITPLFVDNGATASTPTVKTGYVYMVNNGPVQGIIEVRDNGVPVKFTANTTKGLFTLTKNPFGTITCSVQGNNTAGYTNTIPGIITKIVKNYGNSENRFTDSEIDFTSFTNTAQVGVYCKDATNTMQVCNELAKSVSANLICPSISVASDGETITSSKLKLVELKVPSGTPKYTLSDDYMVLGSLSIGEIFPVKPSIKLGYCKNYTAQKQLAAGVNPDNRFDTEYLTVYTIDAAAVAIYKETGKIAVENTLLLKEAAANTESDKRLSLWGVRRLLITATYLPEFIFVQLGDVVTLKSSRFNLSAGKLGIVYSVTRNWITGMVDIGVLV